MIATIERRRPMARKKESPADKRRDWQSVDLLREYAAQLDEQAARLRECADAIAASGNEQVYVDGVKKFINAFPDIAGYTSNVRKAMIDAGIA